MCIEVRCRDRRNGLDLGAPRRNRMSASPPDFRTPRMQALARLPVFFALDGKRVVVAGEGAAAAWKIELISAAGAHVDVYAANPDAGGMPAGQAADGTLHRAAIP